MRGERGYGRWDLMLTWYICLNDDTLGLHFQGFQAQLLSVVTEVFLTKNRLSLDEQTMFILNFLSIIHPTPILTTRSAILIYEWKLLTSNAQYYHAHVFCQIRFSLRASLRAQCFVKLLWSQLYLAGSPPISVSLASGDISPSHI